MPGRAGSHGIVEPAQGSDNPPRELRRLAVADVVV
jgi:hypothetical protein